MRYNIIAIVVIAGVLSAVTLAQQRPAPPLGQPVVGFSQQRADPASWIITPLPNTGGPQQVLFTNPQTQVVSVYHVDQTTGEISLKSVRNIRWDQMMEEYNTAAPPPREIRSLLERR